MPSNNQGGNNPTPAPTPPPSPPPYFRAAQPDTPTSPFTASSYLRLGNYIADETGLPTGLSTTTSSVANLGTGAEAQAEANIANVKNDPNKVYSATSQAATAYQTNVTATIASTNKGVLIFSNADLNQNIVGATLEKLGAGHNVEVTTADAKYAVLAGKYDLSGHHGVFVRGGKVSPTGTVEQAANVEITAGGYIKQTAYGPLEETTYGKTWKKFVGDAYDEFHGSKESKFYGEEKTYKLTSSFSIVLSDEVALRMSTRFSLTLSLDLSLSLALSLGIIVGGKIDIIGPLSLKLVVGPDIKMAVMDMKFLSTTDFKVCPVADGKKVGLNLTVCDISLTYEAAAKVENAALALRKTNLRADLDNLCGTSEAASISTSGIRNLM